MILRILQASVVEGRAAGLVQHLRAVTVPRLAGADGIGTFALGFRHTEVADRFLAVSTWRDFEAITAAADGRPGESIGAAGLRDLLNDIAVDHFELIAPDLSAPPVFDGPVLGVLIGRVRPRSEPHVHAMIEAIRPRISTAGVTTLHIGRRLEPTGGSTLAVIAVWADRAHLQAFARDRAEGAIDPAFTADLLEWRFTTYDCFALDPAHLDGSGPAVLEVDDAGVLVAATPGVEAVLGVPGELLLHRRLEDVFAIAGDGAGRASVSHGRWSGAEAPFEVLLTATPRPAGGRRVTVEHRREG